MYLCQKCNELFEKYILIRNQKGLLVPACPHCRITVLEGKFVEEEVNK